MLRFIAVLAGAYLSQYIRPQMLKISAGMGFVTIGIWILQDLRSRWGSTVLTAAPIKPLTGIAPLPSLTVYVVARMLESNARVPEIRFMGTEL